ncbi:VOC family protein [Cohnella soli]|uniref:VOC family protein n=1 Tax=Cohnella soli TaxID=425005 RepID=A0ABW0I2L1_9BACL
MAKLTPYFYSSNAVEQANFYVQALGGEFQHRMTYGQVPGTDEAFKDKIIHMSFVAAGVTFFIADTMHGTSGSSGYDLSLEFGSEEEASQAFANLSEDGKVIMPLEKQFWGSLFGRLEDRYGIKWQVTTAATEQQG